MDAIQKACVNMDWQQVVLNGGPPCFYLMDDGNFCGRTQRWAGHNHNYHHRFVSLAELITITTVKNLRSMAEIADNYFISPMLSPPAKVLAAHYREKANQLEHEGSGPTAE